MKLYVVPIGSICNASCSFCITKFRKPGRKEFLNPYSLSKVLSKDFERIEITGGGEPTIHPEIEKIIDLCSQKTETQMYTNGYFIPENIEKLSFLCISRAHYKKSANQKIMKTNFDFDRIKNFKIPIKLSLLLHKSGINSERELLNYIKWAKDKAQKIVVRQMFSHENKKYKEYFKKEFVSAENILREEKFGKPKITIQGNKIFDIYGLEVEVESRSCSCDEGNPVLFSNGILYKGWGNL